MPDPRDVLALTRFRVAEDGGPAFLAAARGLLAVLAGCPGHLEGQLARSTDDPSLWVVLTRWTGVGAYRRALSSYDVRVAAAPISVCALNEPSGFELLASGIGPARGSDRAADAATVGLGAASAPHVPTDL